MYFEWSKSPTTEVTVVVSESEDEEENEEDDHDGKILLLSGKTQPVGLYVKKS